MQQLQSTCTADDVQSTYGNRQSANAKSDTIVPHESIRLILHQLCARDAIGKSPHEPAATLTECPWPRCRVVDEQSGKRGPKLNVSSFTSAPWPRPNNKAGQIFTGTLQVRGLWPRLPMPAYLRANVGTSARNGGLRDGKQAVCYPDKT